ncbi:MAG: hypothetical protein ABL860_00095 [Candidatus Nitrotoga sp.]
MAARHCELAREIIRATQVAIQWDIIFPMIISVNLVEEAVVSGVVHNHGHGVMIESGIGKIAMSS